MPLEGGEGLSLHLALIAPEIPPNTGNVARTCVMTATALHLVEPLGFSLSESRVRRSGLDYWPYLDLTVHENFSALRETLPRGRFLCFSTRGRVLYHEVAYRPGDVLVFGSETTGLSPAVLKRADKVLRIPMVNEIPRSLNLGNAVALVLYEALRQLGFPGMS